MFVKINIAYEKPNYKKKNITPTSYIPIFVLLMFMGFGDAQKLVSEDMNLVR